MSMRPSTKASRKSVAGVMLTAFALRALVPPGFMPASDRPFSIEICWEGLPAAALPHDEPMDMGSMGMSTRDAAPADASAHNHARHPSHTEHCVFGTACSAGPVPHLSLLSDISTSQPLRAPAFVSAVGSVRLVHLPQPRAPPGRLS